MILCWHIKSSCFFDHASIVARYVTRHRFTLAFDWIMDEVNAVSPVYAKSSDVGFLKIHSGEITFIICSAINEILPHEVFAAQKIRGLWHIYLKSELSRLALLQQGYFTLNDKRIPVYDDNPLTFRVQTERVTIKDLPIHVSNDVISDYLMALPHIQPVGKILWSMSRNEDNEFSNYANGDRFFDVRADFHPPLPSDVQLGEHHCRIMHNSQSAYCMRCGSASHYTGDINNCAAYLSPEKQQYILPFKHPKNPLTNFWESDMIMDGKMFKSSEHAYMWSMCTELGQHELAARVVTSATPAMAKQISREIPSNIDRSSWNQMRLDVMKSVLESKATSCAVFTEYLMKTGDKYLVEATRDTFWGAGFAPHLCRTTDPANHPGGNHLGNLLMELRATIMQHKTKRTTPISHSASDTNTTTAPIKTSKSNTSTVTPSISKTNTHTTMLPISDAIPATTTPPSSDTNTPTATSHPPLPTRTAFDVKLPSTSSPQPLSPSDQQASTQSVSILVKCDSKSDGIPPRDHVNRPVNPKINELKSNTTRLRQKYRPRSSSEPRNPDLVEIKPNLITGYLVDRAREKRKHVTSPNSDRSDVKRVDTETSSDPPSHDTSFESCSNFDLSGMSGDQHITMSSDTK